MKKCVICLLLFVSVLLCGCSRQTTGNPSELMQFHWHAALEGGGEADLRFEGEHARLILKNGGETAEIAGRVIADDSTFVIFDRELSQNYGFGYTPRGEKLDLSFEGNTIEMEAVEKTEN